MDTLDRDALKRLGASTGGRHVSIFMNTHLAKPENQQDGIRFKNLLREAEAKLLQSGERATDVRELLAPAWRLLDDGLFWRPRRGGLAVFVSSDGLSSYRLPVEFDENAVVNSRFFIKPLIGAVDGGEHFYVLALEREYVRLFKGTRAGIEELPLPEEMPKTLDEAQHMADDNRGTLSWHSSNRGGSNAYGRTPAMFHHSGVDNPTDKRRIVDFFQQVSSAVMEVVGYDTAPMMLATVEHQLPMYREANDYPNLIDEAIVSTPHLLAPHEIHARAWEIVQPLFEASRRQALERFNEYEGTGHASADPPEVLRAAAYGRVDALFVAEDTHLWGSFDTDTGEVRLADERSPEAEDLTDLAVANTVLNGGSVFAGGVRGEPLAAVFRY